MSNPIVLTLIDTMQIQRYIFSSNRLREMVGASVLLKKATEDWLIDALYKKFGVPRPAGDTLDVLKAQKPIESASNIPFEIIYCGGGNAKILFKDFGGKSACESARGFVSQWSRDLLEWAPGIQIAVHHQTVEEKDWPVFDELINRAEAELARKKASFVAHVAELAPPFVVRCPSTGLPAAKHYNDKNNNDKNNERISEQACQKRDAADGSFRHWLEQNGEWKLFLNKQPAAFPQNLDELGQREGNNFIGIIHADGNFMGEKVQAIAAANKHMREYIDKIRQFSINLEEANQTAFQNVLAWISDNYSEWIKKGTLRRQTIREGKDQGKLAFPIRPIIMGGDDFTVVTPGAIALQVAERFMGEFKKACKSWCEEFGLKEITASGGVALVHSHMPFDRAYELAESLASNAKKVERDKRRNSKGDEQTAQAEASWLDWYIATDNHLDTENELRREKYQYRHNSQLVRLTRKPYRLDAPQGDEPEFRQLKKDIYILQDKEQFPRNKLKSLLNLAVEGPTQAAVALREMKYHLKNKEYQCLAKILKNHHKKAALFGEKNGELHTAIFDLVESLEFIVEEQSEGGK